jgi:hypothetical protein
VSLRFPVTTKPGRSLTRGEPAPDQGRMERKGETGREGKVEMIEEGKKVSPEEGAAFCGVIGPPKQKATGGRGERKTGFRGGGLGGPKAVVGGITYMDLQSQLNFEIIYIFLNFELFSKLQKNEMILYLKFLKIQHK